MADVSSAVSIVALPGTLSSAAGGEHQRSKGGRITVNTAPRRLPS